MRATGTSVHKGLLRVYSDLLEEASKRVHRAA